MLTRLLAQQIIPDLDQLIIVINMSFGKSESLRLQPAEQLAILHINTQLLRFGINVNYCNLV